MFTRRSRFASSLAVLVVACGGEDTTAKGALDAGVTGSGGAAAEAGPDGGAGAPGSPGTSCTLNSDCTAPLVCTSGQCHSQCESSRDCPDGQRCMAGGGQGHVCQLLSERVCTLDSECPVLQVCATDGQCRDQCAADRDCVTGQLCRSARCFDPVEAPDGGATSGTGGAAGDAGASDASLGTGSDAAPGTGGAGGSSGSSGTGGFGGVVVWPDAAPVGCQGHRLLPDPPLAQCRLDPTSSLPDATSLDASRVNVWYGTDGGPLIEVPRVSYSGDCALNQGEGWYYANPVSPGEIVLCAGTCAHGATATFRVLVGCATLPGTTG